MTNLQERTVELAANLATVEERITTACAAAGRKRDDVTLIVVTKTYPASDVRILSGLGVRHVAENRDQDAAPKAAECSDLPLTWHFVGQLQTNKVRSVASYAGLVQSVDRGKLVTALSKEAVRAERELGCLIQVALDSRRGRPGARGHRPRRSGGVGRARGRGSGVAARRTDDRRAAHRGLRGAATGGVRAAHGFVDCRARGPSGCEHGLGRDEFGPRAGCGGRSDTCARRYRGPRCPTPARVTSRRSRTTAENMVILADGRGGHVDRGHFG